MFVRARDSAANVMYDVMGGFAAFLCRESDGLPDSRQVHDQYILPSWSVGASSNFHSAKVELGSQNTFMPLNL